MKDKFIKNAFILMAGGVLAKVFSVVYRICLTRVLGGVGIGMYQLIFPVYSLGVVLTTTGIPMAISKVVARNKGNEKCVIRKSLMMISILSIVLTIILISLSKILADWQGSKELAVCYIILAPTFIILGCSSVLRGYFQGISDFTPSAVSSIFEQLVKLAVGLTVSCVLFRFGLLYAVIGAVIGIVISEVVAILILVVCYLSQKNKCKTVVDISAKTILADAMPVVLTNIILPIATFIDSLIVVKLLSQNFSYQESLYLYGLETGAVSSFTSLPTIFSFALASVVLPMLINENDKSSKFNNTIKIVISITLPICLLFVIAPEQLLTFLYGGKLNSLGFDGVKISSILLSLSSIGIFFLSLSQIFSSSLQAEEKRYSTIRNLSFGVFIKFVFEIIFLANKSINIYALAIANSVCYFIVCLLNFLSIKKIIKIQFNLEYILKCVVINSINSLFLIIYLHVNKTPIFMLFGGVLYVINYILLIYLFDLFNIKKYNKYI